jgi:hypothetical protein
MARKKWKPAILLRKAFFIVAGALLTGFLTVFFVKFLGHYLSEHFAVSIGVGLAVAITLWMTQLVRHPPFLLKGTSPLVAGFCAALGVHVARVWLS